MSDVLNPVATVLLTYGVHSAVACLVALLLARAFTRPQDRDLLWKGALILPLVTSATVLVSAQAGASRMRIDLARAARHSGLMALPGRQVLIRVVDNGQGPMVDRAMVDPVTAALSKVAIAIALACVLIAAVRFVRRRQMLARVLVGRRAVQRIAHGNIGLSEAPSLPSPVALHGSEICLPSAVMHDFTQRHRETLVAHEVAHIQRRDPAWFALVELVTVISAFQPFVFLVARAFRRDVELICDEAAVRQTNDRQGLIGALALLASPFDPRSSIQCSPTAYDGSPLVARATRIATLAEPQTHSRRVALLAVAGLLLALGILPVVSSSPRLEDFSMVIPPMTKVVRFPLTNRDSTVVEIRSRVSHLLSVETR